MTDKELDELTNELQQFLASQKGTSAHKERSHKGLFSRLIVLLCLGLAIGYTGICLLMQWRTGVQPEPQLTIVFFGFITVELWNLAKIKRGKDEGKRE